MVRQDGRVGHHLHLRMREDFVRRHVTAVRLAPVALDVAPPRIVQLGLRGALGVGVVPEQALAHAGLELCGTSYEGVSFNHAVASGASTGRRVARDLPGAFLRPEPAAAMACTKPA